MHELGLSQAVLESVLRHARGRRVRTVTLRVGRLRQVVPETLAFCFGIVSRESSCEGATLEQIVLPGRVRCAECEHAWELEEPAFLCPLCGSVAEVVGGDELEIESIEVEEDTCIESR